MNTKKTPVDYLTVLLLSIILVIGTIHFYYSREIDKKYTDLLEQSLKASQASSNILRNSLLSLNDLEEFIYNSSPEKESEAMTRYDNRVHKNDIYYQMLDSVTNVLANKDELNKLMVARLTYRASKDSLMLMNEKGDKTLSRKYFSEVVKPNMVKYQKEQIAFQENMRLSVLKDSEALSQLTSNVNMATIILIIMPTGFMLLILFIIIRILVRAEEVWNESF